MLATTREDKTKTKHNRIIKTNQINLNYYSFNTRTKITNDN